MNISFEELEVMHPAAKLIVMAAKSQDQTGLPGTWGSTYAYLVIYDIC